MVGEIDAGALRDLLGTDDAPMLVDVGSPADYADGHLPGSEHITLQDLPGEIDRIAAADHVVTVCPHGLASLKAARIIDAYVDFDGCVESLAGGREAWDGPLERGSPADDTSDGDAQSAPF